MLVDPAAQPVRNLLRNPKPVSQVGAIPNLWQATNFGTGGAGVDGYDATLSAWYSEVTTAASSSVHTVRYGNSLATRLSVEAGKTYTQTFWVMSTVDDARATAIDWYSDTSASLGSSGNGIRVSLPANTWVKIELTGVAPAGATNASMCVLYAGTSGPAGVIRPVGSRLHIRNAAVGEGSAGQNYADGTFPGWRWLGLANDSASVGYPYTLESIAGRPLQSLIGIGTVPVPAIPALQGRTFYTVYDSLGSQDAYYSIATWTGGAVATNGGFRFQTGNTGGINGARVDTGNGSVNVAFGPTGDNRSPGKHIMCLTINDGMTQTKLLSDSQPEQVRPVTPGDGMPFVNPALMNVDAPNTDAVASYLFGAEHNLETRLRVMNWLATVYGISLVPTNLDGGTSADTVFGYTADGGTSSTTVFDYIFDGGTS